MKPLTSFSGSSLPQGWEVSEQSVVSTVSQTLSTAEMAPSLQLGPLKIELLTGASGGCVS